MLRRIFHVECDRDLLIETVDLAAAEISLDIEYESVNSCRQLLALGYQFARPAVIVRFLSSDSFPTAVVRLAIKPYQDAGRRAAYRNIKNVCGYSAHNDKSFLSLISVIFCCSFAAFTISVARSLLIRKRQSFNISFAVFPVAQTMNMNPNFS